MSFNDPFQHAIEALLWIAPEEITDHDDAQLSPDLEASLKTEWIAFAIAASELGFDPEEHRVGPIDLSQGDERAYMAHDWILTRNRTGCGFWERGRWADEFRQPLTDLCHKQGEVEIYLGDDQLIYSL
jgi:hypothetical protein